MKPHTPSRKLAVHRALYHYVSVLECDEEVAFVAVAYMDALGDYKYTTCALAMLLSWRFHCDKSMWMKETHKKLGLRHAKGLLPLMERLHFQLRPRTVYDIVYDQNSLLEEIRQLIQRDEWRNAKPESLVEAARLTTHAGVN